MNLSELKNFLDEKTIPVIRNKIGFLEIIRKQHYENINSNLYAHFLSCNIDGIRSLFLDTLVSLISEKTSTHLNFANINVSTEVATSSKGRIDIVIEDFNYQSTIIIENKIYHQLYNDLSDYWNHYKVDPSKKVGILLTLYPHLIPESVKGKFINITHLEWITKIKEKYEREMLPDNYKIYLDDFINTIENLTRTNTMNESAKFYFQNAPQINKANEAFKEGHLFLNNQYQLIAVKIGWQTFGNDIFWRNFWDEHNGLDTYLTIVTKDLVYNGNLNFMLVLEMNRKDKNREDEVKDIFKNHPQFLDKNRGESKGTYVHFLCKNYTVTVDELEHFSDIVVEKIKHDFAEITIDVIKYLYPNTDISTFENQFNKKIDQL